MLIVCLLLILAGTGQAQLTGIKNPHADNLLEKGNAYTGLTFSIGKNDVVDEDGMFVFINEQQKSKFAFSIDGGYFLAKNFAVGALVEYSNNRISGVFTPASSGLTSIAKEQKTDLGFYGVAKAFIPLDQQQRFALFNQVLLGGTYKSKLLESTTESVLTRTFVENKSVELRFSPGIQVHVIRGFCMEAGTEIAGIRKSWNLTTVNGEATTKGSSFTADLTINLLRLRLGFYYYFPTKFSKK
jgi:hypothetical protein